MIQRYTREAGVRNLEREIASICRKIARKAVTDGGAVSEKVGAERVTEYLRVPKYRPTVAEEQNEVGIATGLAWTEVGGEILVTEATLMPGKGTLTLTGKLGDVMQESTQAAMSYVRSKAEEFGIPKDFNRKTDVHVHVPEGAIPKDGPSATASPLLKGDVNISLGCDGSARNANLDDNSLVVGIPFSMMEDICIVLRKHYQDWDAFMRGWQEAVKKEAA